MSSLKRTFSTTVEPVAFSAAKKRKMSTTRKSKTTLQRNQDGPFPRFKRTKFVYENALTAISGGLTFNTKPVLLNSLYDFDKGADIGNKQPLFYDAMLTSSGPYKNYKVISWKTTWTFINTGADALNIWVLPPVAGTGEIDSAAESDNFPGVKRLHLTAKGGAKDIGSVTVTGNISDVYNAAKGDLGFLGGYNTDPAYTVYGGYNLASADGSTVISGYVAVKHIFDVELDVIDALVS